MKIHVITGASDGIGAELARQLARAAARRRRAGAGGAQPRQAGGRRRAMRGAGRRTRWWCPPTSRARPQCRALIDTAVHHFGGIDCLVNNAGVSAQALFDDVSAEDLHWYEDLMTVNLWGAVWCTHAALPHLKAARGQIVAVSSLAGLIGVPGRTAYSATKFAMTGFFEALRTELKPAGVSVTVAYPGVVATDIRDHGCNAQGRAGGAQRAEGRRRDAGRANARG